MIREAFIEGENRFWLLRDWANGDLYAKTLTFVMLNPSTADAVQDDHTVRKCVGFATKLGYGRMYVVNLFSKRATDPAELRFGVGRWMTNQTCVRSCFLTSDGVVFAWGASLVHADPDARSRSLRGLAGLVREHGIEPMCFGVSQDGHPRHPLMLPYTTQLEPWKGYDAPEWSVLKKAKATS